MMPGPIDKIQPEKRILHPHSRYAPEAEAERHLDVSLAGKKPALVFILGAGKNYLGLAIKKALPGATTVVLQTSPDFDSSLVDQGDYYWSPDSAYPIEDLLDAALATGKAAGGVALIEWPPASRRHPHTLESIRCILQQALEKYASESATTGYWGRRWLRNSIDFACGQGPLSLPASGTGALVLACAGPGLESTLPGIRNAGGELRLWALASAHQALASARLEPELLICTDPGFWNTAHLALAARQATAIAATPGTRLGASILDGKTVIMPVSTGLGFEQDALAAAGVLVSVKALSSGTASGTALSIGLELGFGPIYLCGLDFAAYGLVEHASPYAFDLLDTLKASRLSPPLGSRFLRVMERYPETKGLWRLSRAFSAYALDVSRLSGGTDIYRVSASPVETGLPTIDPSSFRCDTLATQVAAEILPPVKSCERIYYRKNSARERFQKMLALLHDRASRTISGLAESIDTGSPVPRETVLELLAFGGRGCAASIAKAARQEADKTDLLAAEQAVHGGLFRLTRGEE